MAHFLKHRDLRLVYIMATVVGIISGLCETNTTALAISWSGATFIGSFFWFASWAGLSIGYLLVRDLDYDMGDSIITNLVRCELALAILNATIVRIGNGFHTYLSAWTGPMLGIQLLAIFVCVGAEDIVIANLAANIKKKTHAMTIVYFCSTFACGMGGFLFGGIQVSLPISPIDTNHIAVILGLCNLIIGALVLWVFKEEISHLRRYVLIYSIVFALLFPLW